jgi:hypothetical protein
MFFEWKSGDYTIRGMKPKYYVLKKEPAEESVNTTAANTRDAGRGRIYVPVRLELKHFDKGIPLGIKTFDEPLLTINSVRFHEAKGRIEAVLRMRVTSYPKKSWKISFRLVDKDGRKIDSAVKAVENSGIAEKVPQVTVEILKISFDKADSSDVKWFDIKIGEFEDTSADTSTRQGRNRAVEPFDRLRAGSGTGGNSRKSAGQDKQEETKKSEFEQLLHKPVTLDISKSPDSNRLTVQYAVINVCEAAGIPYQWGKSAKLADPERRNYIEPVHIKGKFVSEAINDILNPFGLSYGLDANGLYLYRSDLQKPVRPYFPVAIAQIARDLLQATINLHQLKAQNASQAEINEVENRIEALGETMDEVCNDLGKKMEVSGEQLAKKIEALAEKVDKKNGEQFAERIVKEIEAWGEKFSEQFKEQFDRQIKSAGQGANRADKQGNSRAGKNSEKSDTATEVKKARALRIKIYEGNDVEPQTSVRMPLVAMKIVRQLLPSKDKLQIIAQKIKLDENLPQDMNSTTLIDMLDDMLKKLDEGVESTTLLEVKDGEERIIIALE